MNFTATVSYDTAATSTATTQAGHGNGGAMQSLENDTTVSHPSHSPLEDADETSVSHIPTASATFLCFESRTYNGRVSHGKDGRRRWCQRLPLSHRPGKAHATITERGPAVKRSLLLLATTGLALAATTATGTANGQTKHLQPNAPRTIVVLDSDTPPVIRAGLLQSTLIMLPAEEKVATVFGGDTVSWVFDGGHVASRYISIKPKLANSTTDIHIVSDHGNEYTLQLREISSDSDAHFDSKVFITPGDKAGKEKLAELPVFVPAAEAKEKEDQLQKEVSAAKAAAAIEQKAATAVQKAAATEAEQYRSSYPGQLHFDYSWDQKKGTTLGIQQIWRDDKFTYLRGHFQETPALYELKDGKGSLINFDFSNGLYTVPKTVEMGYLAIGKQKVEFKRVGGGN